MIDTRALEVGKGSSQETRTVKSVCTPKEARKKEA